MPWRGNTEMRQGNGAGNGCFPRAAAGGIHDRGWRGDITWIRALCSAPCRRRDSDIRTIQELLGHGDVKSIPMC